MTKELWIQIQKGQDVRQNLSKIRQIIKNQEEKSDLIYLVKNQEEALFHLLKSEDAKTRKNAALLMGDLGKQIFMKPLWNAYQEESQRFIKSSYLVAISSLDYWEYIEEIKERLSFLRNEEITIENQKHNMEEMRELTNLILNMEGVASRRFIGRDNTFDIVLLTNRNFKELTKKELLEFEPSAKTKILGAGVMARVNHLWWLRDVRTYQELLFVVRGMEKCEMNIDKIAQTITESPLLDFLSKNHEGSAPYYFRLEMKSKIDLGQKSVFLKKLSSKIEVLSEHKLINTTNNYEFELRLIEDKMGNCNIMVKLFTLPDTRFTYRTEVIPTSIKPVNAALTVALAKEYLKEDGQVLDPFCGVGTMLIERHKGVRANTTYGIDWNEDAIFKARKNTDTAKQMIHYINKDFFQFQHEYLFDEVITNMPFQIGRFTEDEVYELYVEFFHTIPLFLKEGAILVLYTHNKEDIENLTLRTDFSILHAYEISRKEGTHVVILRYM